MFHTTIQPRVSETDGVGHINNTTIPVWFEAAREPIFRLFMPNLSFNDWRMIIVNMNVDYLAQVYYGKPVEIVTWVKKIGNTSFVLEEELTQEGRTCAKGTATYINFNQTTQKPEPIPPDLRSQLKQHQKQR
ncbi:MAG: thioesterase family protein [Firmicutes bacterium]|uniref:Acyl-CoA thioester hydrolase n=1 Tax=Melghirimyces thermohalophilus TaxID=1236220 RepID=A0A1G6KVA7_9BACL|nr:thioesterase family protein [Melghirimyces thermohalophilus]MDA8353309.1 thioesterase family protein [Bacillota bacterium]SDC35032.1 acyl-CoA thioester hydrolase [Melghirimyces thermohalophilus]